MIIPFIKPEIKEVENCSFCNSKKSRTNPLVSSGSKAICYDCLIHAKQRILEVETEAIT